MKTSIATVLLSVVLLLASLTVAQAPDLPLQIARAASPTICRLPESGKDGGDRLFFTYCPPCNAIAPLVEPLYYTLGGGNGDVEFISLSTKMTIPARMSPPIKPTTDTHLPGRGRR